MFRSPALAAAALALAAGGIVGAATPPRAEAAEPVEVGGTLTSDTTWTAEGGPYRASSPVVIPAGVTLTIEPGVVVNSAFDIYDSERATFEVAGSLRAVGTPEQPITLSNPGYALLGGPIGSTAATATGVVTVQSAKLEFHDLLHRYVAGSTRQVTPALAELTVSDSRLTGLNGGTTAYLDMTRTVNLTQNAVAMGVNVTDPMHFNPANGPVTLERNRLRGVQVRCAGSGLLTLRDNTLEAMVADAWVDGSGLSTASGCGIDARDNYWESSGDLESRISDGVDTPGLPVADISTRLTASTPGTPTLPPGWPGWSDGLQIRAYDTGVTSWWDSTPSGGLPVTYTVEALPEGLWGAERTVETTSTGIVFQKLDTTKRYRIRVTPHNDMGPGRYSLLSDLVYPIDVSWADVAFSEADRTVAENSSTITVAVYRSGDTSEAASVQYARTAGSATPGTDFVLPPGILTFAPGQESATIPLTVVNDSAREAEENLTVTLSSPSAGTSLGSPSATTITISPSDQQPDGWISTASSSGYVGNNIYNTTGASQTKRRSASRGQTRTFYVRVYNDGNGPNTFVLKGSAARSGSTVRYFSGTTDISTAMRSAAGYSIRINAGAYRLVKVQTKVRPGAAIGSLKPATVSAAWTGDDIRRDVVKARVKVIP